MYLRFHTMCWLTLMSLLSFNDAQIIPNPCNDFILYSSTVVSARRTTLYDMSSGWSLTSAPGFILPLAGRVQETWQTRYNSFTPIGNIVSISNDTNNYFISINYFKVESIGSINGLPTCTYDNGLAYISDQRSTTIIMSEKYKPINCISSTLFNNLSPFDNDFKVCSKSGSQAFSYNPRSGLIQKQTQIVITNSGASLMNQNGISFGLVILIIICWQ